MLPLAYAAYAGTWNAKNNAKLATFTDVAEILVDTDDADFKKMAAKSQMSNNSHAALAKMRAPAGSNPTPTPSDVLMAEGGIAADPGAPAPALRHPPHR